MAELASAHLQSTAPRFLPGMDGPGHATATRLGDVPAGKTPAHPRQVTGIGSIFLVLLLDLIGFSIVFPLYAHLFDYYADSGLLACGMSVAEYLVPVADHGQRAALFGGLMGAAYSLLQFLAAPWWGRLSDRIGRRPVLLASIGGNCVAYVLWMFAGDFSVLLLSRLIAGTMTGNTAVAHAAVADITSPEHRGRCMGQVGMAFGLGLLIGPVIGGISYEILPRLDQVPLLAHVGANPFSTPALIACLLSVVNLTWVYFQFHETLPSERRQPEFLRRPSGPFSAFNTSAVGKSARTVHVGFAIHILLFSGMEATLVFLAWERCGFSVGDTMWLFVGMGVTSALMQGGVVRRLRPGIDQRQVAMVGLVALLPGYVFIGSVDWWPHPPLLFMGIVLLAIGSGLVFPAFSTLASLHAHAAVQGRAMGSLRAAGALGRAAGPLLAAGVYFLWRPGGPYVVAAIGLLLPLILLRQLRRIPTEGQADG